MNESQGTVCDGLVQDCGISSASALEIPVLCLSHLVCDECIETGAVEWWLWNNG